MACITSNNTISNLERVFDVVDCFCIVPCFVAMSQCQVQLRIVHSLSVVPLGALICIASASDSRRVTEMRCVALLSTQCNALAQCMETTR